MRGNERDPFMHCLLAMTLERLGRQDEAKATYQSPRGLRAVVRPAETGKMIGPS